MRSKIIVGKCEMLFYVSLFRLASADSKRITPRNIPVQISFISSKLFSFRMRMGVTAIPIHAARVRDGEDSAHRDDQKNMR